MKYFSMFSGIGTGEKGIEQAFGGKEMYQGTVTFRFEAETEEEAESIAKTLEEAARAAYPEIDSDTDIWDGE